MATVTKITTLAFAAIAAAASLASSNQPCLSSEFTLSMRYNNAYLSLGAIESGHDGTLNIVGFDPDAYRGTPVKQMGTSPNATLAFDIQPGDDCETDQTGEFGIDVPDLGELYGAQHPILGAKGVEWPHFYVGSGFVDPMRTAASQEWYACNITVLGKPYVGLSWGLYNSNGSSPWGCQATQVKTNFNIPCGT